MGVYCLAVFRPAAIQAAEPDTATWKAGVARLNITPDKLMWMSGYADRTKPAQGKLTDLWAKALVLEDPDGRRVVLVPMDLAGIPHVRPQPLAHDLQRKPRPPRAAPTVPACNTR